MTPHRLRRGALHLPARRRAPECKFIFAQPLTCFESNPEFPQWHSLKEVIEMGKKAIDWDGKWHSPSAKRLDNGRI
jgi:hypothetical protein